MGPASWPRADEDELLGYREQFPILSQAVCLISNSLGAMPCAVHDALRAYAEA